MSLQTLTKRPERTHMKSSRGAAEPAGTTALGSLAGETSSCDRLADAREALAHSSVVELRDLLIDQEGERLTITGSVQCFYHKQLAQETVRPHAGEMRMVNQVRVEQ